MTRFKILLGLVVLLTSVLGIGLLTFWDSEVGYSDTPTWYSANWSSCIEFTVNASYVDSDLTNFPVLITGELIDQGPSHFWTTVDVNGSDILFTDADGNKLYRELVSIDTTNMSMECYVNVSSVDDTIDTPIYMYYGNAGASESNDTETWNSNYVGVWHFNDNPDTSTIQDSTASNIDGTKKGANEPLAIEGNFAGDKAQKFDYVDDYITLTNFNASAGADQQGTLESIWDSYNDGEGHTILGFGDDADTNRYITFQQLSSDNRIQYGFSNNSNTAGIDRMSVRAGQVLSTGEYYYTVTASDNASIRFYRDGLPSSITVTSGTNAGQWFGDMVPPVASYTVNIGNLPISPASVNYMNGSVTELRYSNVSCSDDWIESTYYSLMSPEDFCPVTRILFDTDSWSDSIKFEINSSYVDSDLTDFPVLISSDQVAEGNPNFWTTVNSSGADIVFTDGTGSKLCRELVSLNTSAETIECYAKVEDISSTVDTPIYMWYGNPAAVEINDTETWDANYIAVYHMGDLNTSAVSDSTSNGNTGTKKGANEPIEIAGNFAGDKGQNIDGVDDYIKIAHNDNFMLNTGGTIESIFDGNSVGETAGRIFSKEDATNALNGYSYYISASNTVTLKIDIGVSVTSEVNSVLYDNWYQGTVKWNDSGLVTHYINGVISGTPTISNDPVGITTVIDSYIGQRSEATDRTFDGNISEIRLSNVSRSADWIESTYYSLMSPEDFCPASVYTLTYSTESGGSLTGDTSQEVPYGANGTAVESVPDSCHYFIDWSDSETDNPRTDLNVSSDLSVTANLGLYNYSISYTAGANGNISGTLNQTVDCGGSSTTVTAVPDYCYHFVNWSDSSEMNPRYESNVSTNISVTANFAASGPYTLTYTAGANGSVVGTTPQSVACGSDGTEVEAVPEDGYWFSSWSDGSVTNPRTDTAVTDDVTVTAVFLNTVPPGSVVMDPPTTLQILDAKVFQDFVSSDDQLFVVSYIIEYEGVTPTQDIRNYWNLDIYDGAVLKARGKVRFWNYGPGSIYLAPTSALTWGSEYTIELTSVINMVSTDPSTSYNLSGADWITNAGTSGFDCEPLDDWVIETAESIDIYNSEPGTLTVYVPGYGTLLSNAGSQMFSIAIPNLMEVCPDTFSIVAESIDPDSTPSDSLPTTGQTSLTNNFGATVITAFDNLGSHIGGLSGHILAGVFWFVIMLIVAGIGTGVSGSPVVGVIVALPILFIGNYLGVISLALMGVIGTLCILYLLRQLWLVGQ